MAIYLVVYEASESLFLAKFIDKLQKFPHFKQVFEGGWLIESNKPATELGKEFYEFFQPGGRQFMVTKVSEASWRLAPENESWLRAHIGNRSTRR